jgi:DNA-binding SARP family transcriptional activator
MRALLRDDGVVLHLFGGLSVSIGQRQVAVPEGSKRLLAFVALHTGRVDRRYVAGTLWPSVDDLRAAGNLRSSLWRLNRAGVTLIETGKTFMALSDRVTVDVHVVNEWFARLNGGVASNDDLSIYPNGVDAIDLLPGWYDDWALAERERIRQRMLRALELMSAALTQRGRYGEAIDAAMLAVIIDPLRETAQRALVEAHIAEGNWSEATRQFSAYRVLLAAELGAQPHASFVDLFRPILRRAAFATA